MMTTALRSKTCPRLHPNPDSWR